MPPLIDTSPYPCNISYRMKRLYFEDYNVGGVETASETYELTADEIIEFAGKWDPEDFHIDLDAAAASVFGGLTASGTHILAVFNRLVHCLPSRAHAIAGLGLDEVRFHAPARPGNRLTLRSECIDARPSASKPDRGIVRFSHVLTNEQDQSLLTLKATVLVRRRPPTEESN